jgi:hypothetical protein
MGRKIVVIFFSALRGGPENFYLLGFDAFLCGSYVCTDVSEELLSLKRPYTPTSLHGVTFHKCNNELLLLTCY